MNKAAPLETEEDLQLIQEYILLPLLLDVLEKDIAALERAELKMGMMYTRSLRHVQNETTVMLSLTRQKMRERGIKVYEQRRTGLGVEVRYLCRGYNHKFSMLWSLVKAQLSSRLAKLLHIDVEVS